MDDSAKVLRLETELLLRKRTILFLLSEYLARYEDDRQKVIDFLDEVMADMPPASAAIAGAFLSEAKGEAPRASDLRLL